MSIPPAAGPRPTIRDVARVAGVSIKTVSRVINDQQYVAAAKRERVLAVMAELGFQPNHAARALAGHRSHQIALICDNPNPWYVYEVQLGLRERLGRAGIRLIAQPYDRGSPTLLADIVALIDQTHPDGIVLTPPACDDRAVLAELTRRRLPFVRIQPGVAPDASPSVRIDNEAAAAAMTTKLVGLGHRRIGFIVGDGGYAVSEQRLAGHARALAAAGVTIDPALVRRGRFDFDAGIAEADALLALRSPPSAIFASSDDIAAGVLAAAHRRQVAVPYSLSVVGFDDAPLARMVWPALTTVHQPVRALAESAADLLLGDGDADEGARERVIGFNLVDRDSAAPPALDASR